MVICWTYFIILKFSSKVKKKTCPIVVFLKCRKIFNFMIYLFILCLQLQCFVSWEVVIIVSHHGVFTFRHTNPHMLVLRVRWHSIFPKYSQFCRLSLQIITLRERFFFLHELFHHRNPSYNKLMHSCVNTYPSISVSFCNYRNRLIVL